MGLPLLVTLPDSTAVVQASPTCDGSASAISASNSVARLLVILCFMAMSFTLIVKGICRCKRGVPLLCVLYCLR